MADTKEKLLKAALFLFQSEGYHAVGVTAILEKAGVPKGSLYHHYPGGKAELAAAVIRRLERSIAQSFESAAGKRIPARKLVDRLYTDTAQWVQGNGYAQGALLSVMAQEVVPRDAALTACLEEAFRATIHSLATALVEGGVDETDAQDLAGTILATLNGAVAQARAMQAPTPILTARTVVLRLLPE